MLVKTQEIANAGGHENAIKLLWKTIERYPSSAPYAHSLLGVEYAKTGQFTLAVSVLEAAAKELPHYAGNYSNLAYALCFLGQFDRAGTAVRRALELDRDSTTANMIQKFLDRRKEALNAVTEGRPLEKPVD
jgi:Flp pilus assembly protein TadD